MDYCNGLPVLGGTSTIDEHLLETMFSTASCFLGSMPPAAPAAVKPFDWYGGASDLMLAALTAREIHRASPPLQTRVRNLSRV